MCLSSLVAIHDGDGHDEEANVGLGRKSRREGGREGGREEGREGGRDGGLKVVRSNT